MRRFSKSMLVCLALLMSLLLATPVVAAKDHLIPGGPATEGNLSLASIITYADMIKILNDIEKTSRGKVEVFTLDEYGMSEAGRSLYVAKVGNGKTKVWIQARIHGNEQLTTEALLEILKTLGRSGDKDTQKILSELTIYAIPIYNPDGSEKNQRGTDVYDNNGNIVKNNLDLNRDWKVDLKGEGMGFAAKESQAFYAFWCDVKPDYALDLHHQGIKQMYDSNESVSMSLGVSLAINGPTLPGIKDGYYNDLCRQMHGYVYDALEGYGYTHVDRYAGQWEIDIYGGVSSAMMLGINYDNLNPDNHSCPTIFFETKGQTRSLGQKSSGYLIKQNYHGIRALLSGLATGDIFEMDTERWEDIPHPPIVGYQTDWGGWIRK